MIKHLFKNICINCITLADPLFVQLKTCWAFAIKTPGGIDTVVAASTFVVPFTFIYVCVEKNIMKKSINGENNCQTKQNKKHKLIIITILIIIMITTTTKKTKQNKKKSTGKQIIK